MERLETELTLRKDTPKVIEFLSAIVTALAAENTLSPKDLDDLRLGIRSLKPGNGLNQSALLTLAQEKSETLHLMRQRFGAAGLAINLFRLTLRKPVADLKKSLCTVGDCLLQKSQLYFNRPFMVKQDGQADYQTLLASVLIELAKQIDGFVERLARYEEGLQELRPSQFGDPVTDQRICEALGFDTVGHDALPLQKESLLKNVIAEECKNLSQSLNQFLQHLPKDIAEAATLDWLSENLMEEGNLLSHWQFDHAHHWERWEWRRLGFIQAIEHISATTARIVGVMNHILPKLAQETREPVLTGAMEREIVFAMMVKGVPSQEAHAATQALRHYCLSHQLRPDRLIAAELPKIHPLLLEEYFVGLGRAAQEHSLTPNAQAEKERLLSLRQTLSHRFARVLTAGATTVALFLVMNVSGCGLKAAPRSEVEDFRPAIPFQDKDSASDKNGKQQKPAVPPANGEENHP